MKRTLLVVVLSIVCLFTYCQYPQVNFEHIYINQGLPEPFLASIIQDNKGFIWAAQSKLYKYDGYKFTTIENLPKCKDCPANNSAGIYTMTTDELGIIWILMDAGIVLFDPESEKSVVLRPYAWNDTANPYLFQRLDILKDTGGNMWISGLPGLLKVSYKPEIHKPVTKEDIFGKRPETVYNIDTLYFKQDKYSVANAVISFYEDSRGNIWAGSIEGIYIMQRGEKSFFRIDDDQGKTRLTQRSAFRIIEENEDTFWVSTLNGINKITNVRNALMDEPSGKVLLKFSGINDLKAGSTELIKDRENRIISGLYLLRKNNKDKSESLVSLYPGINDPQGNGYDMSAFKIMQDRTGVIWALQSIDGILKFNLGQSQFISYNKIVADHVSGHSVNSITEDEEGNLIVGSFGEGLIRIRNNSSKVTAYDAGFGMNEEICLAEIRPGIYWTGLMDGVIEFNSHTGKFRNPFTVTRESRNLMTTTVWDILKNGQQVYMATEAGIFVYDFKSQKLSQFSVTNNDSTCNKSEAFYALLKTKDGSIWTSSIGRMGLCKINYDQSTGNLTYLPFKSRFLSTENLINNYNSVLYQDRQGLIWVGNSNLHSINIQTGEILTYKLNTRLQNWIIRSIQEDSRNNLWMGTITGLICFNTRTGKFRIYTSEDGLPVSLHEHHASYKGKNGRMYFGGSRGFYSFHPDSLKINDSIPPVVITDFRLFNKSVKIDTSSKKSILSKNISYTGLIKLRHNQNDLTFEFAALDYNQPMSNKFAYKLEPYQDEWVETDAGNRVASYTNLDPGYYIFRVKGTNNDGVWNEEGTSLSVIISKPWWATTMAWMMYIVIFMAAIRQFIHWRSLKLKKTKEELEKLVRIRTRQLEEQKAEIITQREEILSQRDKLELQNLKITENEDLKNRFFTNVSHEFRTPLSLIQSPVEELLEDTRLVQRHRQKLNLVLKNSNKLLKFVNQLLDISKIDGSSMKLELTGMDVMKYLRAIAGSFTSLAETKSIRYDIHVENTSCDTWSDPDKLEKIAVNLLSNAFKFTPEGGEIIFSARYAESSIPQSTTNLEFSVADTGTGIPDTSLQKIFDRFYQVESSLKREGAGTGIGLSLAMEMARLMHGDIKAESELCKGSKFRVNIPLGKEHLKESEYIVLQSFPEFNTSKHVTESYAELNSEPLNGSGLNKPIVMIVEDNKDIRLQINENLRDQYQISEAIDGVAGMKKATEIIPDLIITDLMMPRMDGFEMCDKLKKDERTSHIPIIMLTAKVTLQDKIDGYYAGADEYIPKPFHMAELKARVANILEQRKKLRERFSKEITLQPNDISVTSLDEKFLRRAIEVVERHIGDENFDLLAFRSEMNMSRSTLFRKLQALTGQSPTEFIRTFRLKRAADLLKKHFGNITQVSYEVGFNNLSYFNRSFKKLYGVSATEYARV